MHTVSGTYGAQIPYHIECWPRQSNQWSQGLSMQFDRPVDARLSRSSSSFSSRYTSTQTPVLPPREPMVDLSSETLGPVLAEVVVVYIFMCIF